MVFFCFGVLRTRTTIRVSHNGVLGWEVTRRRRNRFICNQDFRIPSLEWRESGWIWIWVYCDPAAFGTMRRSLLYYCGWQVPLNIQGRKTKLFGCFEDTVIRLIIYERLSKFCILALNRVDFIDFLALTGSLRSFSLGSCERNEWPERFSTYKTRCFFFQPACLTKLLSLPDGSQLIRR